MRILSRLFQRHTSIHLHGETVTPKEGEVLVLRTPVTLSPEARNAIRLALERKFVGTAISRVYVLESGLSLSLEPAAGQLAGK